MQHATTTDGALEMYPGAGIANIGIMLFRSSAKIFAEVLHTLLCQQLMSSTCGVEDSQLWSKQAVVSGCDRSSCRVYSPEIKLVTSDLKI